MKLSKLFLAASGLSVAVLLSACSGGHYGSYSNGSGWGNYKCTAVRGKSGPRFMGWSTHKSNARAAALGKCEAGYNGSCHISQCVDQM